MIYDYIETLISYSIKHNLIEESDRVYFKNRIIAFLNLDVLESGKDLNLGLEDIINGFCDYAILHNMINDNITERDIFDTELMGILTKRPSEVIKEFNELYKIDPIKATDYFYKYSIDTNYIRKYRIDRDLKWDRRNSKYGRIDITINLSKPEKDPKEIAKAKLMPKSNYPICLLCKENEGYKGRLNHPARSNIRLIPVKLEGEDFLMQYSPYSYYNEHAIILSSDHHPMIIDKMAIKKLLDFVTIFPHYFIGSNADLPIVGGSILAHEHFQGGRYRFAMEDAKCAYKFTIKKYPNIRAQLIKWPLSVIRIASFDKDELAECFNDILNFWINYSDEEIGIISHTNGERHNTITPIARINDDGLYELDLTLRNNRTSDEYPLGIYHPHPEYHHIKKENIGLIEVMGLAILPSRLKDELKEVKYCLLNDTDPMENEVLVKHAPWINHMKKMFKVNSDNVDKILEDEIARIFINLLEDCGVYKQTTLGINHFKMFTDKLNEII